MRSRGRPRKGERRLAIADDQLDESTPVDFELDSIAAHDVRTGDPIRELELGNSSNTFARRQRDWD